MSKIYFDLDVEKCTACCACVLACMDQNDIDVENNQHPYRNAFEYEEQIEGKWFTAYLSVSCQHCDDAPCVTACPTGCLYKDDETGLTLYKRDLCIGCHSCSMACPFGAISFNAEGKMVKCDGCIERISKGMIPACVRVCPGGALSCKGEEEYHKDQNACSLRSLAKRFIRERR